MSRFPTDPDALLLDPDVWDAPAHLSDEDLYAQAGAQRRHGVEAGDPEIDR